MKRIASLVIALTCAYSVAQVPGTGAYKFASLDNRGFDQVNIGNLNTRFTIPIVTKQGRGLPFVYTLQYEGLIWQPVNDGTSTAWVPSPNWGFNGSLDGTGVIGYLSYASIAINGGTCGSSTSDSGRIVPNPGQRQSSFVYHDALGAAHAFNYMIAECMDYQGDTFTRQIGDGSSVDESGYSLINSGTQVQTTSGMTITPSTVVNGAGASAAGSQVDANGNELTFDGTASYTDTTGTTELTISGSNPVQLTYPVALQSSGATTASASITYRAYTVRTNFACSGVTEYGSATTNLIDHITLADGSSSYSFTYEPTPGATDGAVTGRLASVTLPTGGAINYSYTGGTSGANGIWCSDGTTGGLTRQTSDGTKTYVRASVSGTSAYTTTVTDEKQNQSLYHFTVDSIGQYEMTHEQAYQSNQAILLDAYQCYNGATAPCDGVTITQPITASNNIKSFNGGSQVTEADTYDPTGQYLLESKQIGTSLMLDTINTYSTPGPVTELTSTTVKDGSGNVVSYVRYGYDEVETTATSSLPQHLAPSASPGNLTSVSTSIDGSTTNLLVTTTSYYDTGMPSTVSTTGALPVAYTYDATGTFATSTALPTSQTNPSNLYLTTTSTYDAASGAVLNASGANAGQTATVTNYDPLLRPAQINQPSGGQLNVAYTDPNYTGTTEALGTGSTAQSGVTVDAYGRQSRTYVFNGSSNPSADWYQTDTCYDQTGLPSFSSTPYEGPGQTAPIQCSGLGRSTLYDALGRPTQVTNADGYATASYQNRAVLSTDVNGVQKITQYDLLGRVSGICEISSTPLNGISPTACGMDISGTGFITSYTYDLANHKTTITQGTQNRVFQTDAAGRTIFVQEPERGITSYSYSYNSTGLVVVRARPQANQTNPSVLTHTTTQYDDLGRVLQISYDDGLTPTKQFWYDVPASLGWTQTPTNPKGQLVNAATVNSSNTVLTALQYSYDLAGNVVGILQCAPSICGTSNQQSRGSDTATYDFAGNITGIADPVSGAITYTRTAAGELTGATQTTYTDPTNTPNLITNVMNSQFGPTSYSLGNGLSVVKGYDSLGRNNGIFVCSGSTSLFCSGGTQIYGNTETYSGVRNTQMCDTVINQCENHGYDGFNRLTSVSGGNSQYTYSYDIYGNRLTQTSSPSGPAPSYGFTNNQIGGLPYDAAGNLMSDGISHSFTYDAEGNVLKVDNGSTASYAYDAMNRRVSAQTSAGTSEYVYSTQGQRTATWLVSPGSAGSGVEGRIFWDGQQIAYRSWNGSTYFQHKNPIGTDRVRTDYQGNLATSEDSLAFGDAFSSSSGDPTGAAQDNDQFAGLEHDSESASEHATFRQYSSTQGRWMSPDPYDGSYDSTNPQSLNRYAYVLNNPMRLTDPLGLDDPEDPCAPGSVEEARSGRLHANSECLGDEGGGGLLAAAPSGTSWAAPPSGTMICDASGFCTYYVTHNESCPAGVTLCVLGGGNAAVGAPGSPVPGQGTVEPAAPNKPTPRTPAQCAGQALKKNAVALTLDAAGVGAGFLPGGDFVVAGVQGAVSVASGINSAVHGDAVGSVLGTLGLPTAYVVIGAKSLDVGAKAIPFFGAALSAFGAINDGISTYKDYQTCLAGG